MKTRVSRRLPLLLKAMFEHLKISICSTFPGAKMRVQIMSQKLQEQANRERMIIVECHLDSVKRHKKNLRRWQRGSISLLISIPIVPHSSWSKAVLLRQRKST